MKYKDSRIRINIFFILFIVLFFVAVSAKMAYVAISSVVEGTDLQKLSKSRVTVTQKITAERGNIYDASNNLLAQNMNSYTVIA